MTGGDLATHCHNVRSAGYSLNNLQARVLVAEIDRLRAALAVSESSQDDAQQYAEQAEQATTNTPTLTRSHP